MSNIIPAAAVILFQQNVATKQFEVLLLQRNPNLKVHGGSWVFPGGKFDPSDYDDNEVTLAPSSPPPTETDILKVARRAAIRETLEEAGISVPPGSLHFYSRWLTPQAMKKRFDTYFFCSQADSDDVRLDEREVCDFLWLTPQEGLNRHFNGELLLPPPTFVTLHCLSEASTRNTRYEQFCIEPSTYQPRLISFEDGLCSLYEEDAGYQDEDYYAKGMHHRLIMRAGKYEYVKDA